MLWFYGSHSNNLLKGDLMKVCFVIPRINFIFPNPYLALGVGYLASILRGEFDLSIIDGQILTQDEYDYQLANLDCDILLLSATLRQLKESLRIADLTRSRLPDCQIIAGGPAFGTVPTGQLIGTHSIGTVVIGEAEGVILPILRKSSISDLESMGFSIRQLGAVTEISALGCRPDINSLALPDWELFDVRRYRESWLESTGVYSMQVIGSRGCPFSCAFCDKTVTGPIYRPRAVKDVVCEMATIVNQYKPDEVFYNDDLFTVSEARVMALSDAIRHEVGAIRWSAQSRVDTLTIPMLESMKTAGCEELFFGVESGSDKILSLLGKKTNRDQIKKAFSLCHSVGIKPGAYLIVGVPGETVEDIDDTISLLGEIKPAMINLSWLTPFPGTEIFKRTVHLISEHDYSKWDDFRCSPYGPDCFGIAPSVSGERIKRAFDELVLGGMEHADWFKITMLE
jgi:anaerobic magnesium-protoporphyrin IX monomethyl ester cyclase